MKLKIEKKPKPSRIVDPFAFDMLVDAPVGSRVWFSEESRPYRIRARSPRYIVATKPYNPMKTVLYTIVDLVYRVRGAEDLVFGAGAETDRECRAMIRRLDGLVKEIHTEISRRNKIPLSVDLIKESK